MPEKKNRNPGKTILLLCSAVVFLFGLSVLLYPSVNRIWTGCLLRRNAEAFLSFVHTDSYEPNEPVDPTGQGSEDAVVQETLPEQYPELWQKMHAYNEAIFLSGQAGLSDKSAYETPSFVLADYGLESEVFAVLSIPKLNMEMPI